MKIKIGLEIHVALDTTEHKLFSKSKFSFATAPNSTINYFDLAYPGTLPVLNKQAIKLALITCYFLKATVSDYLSFERKHYFYSDLPKGYQLTQRDNPIGKNGYLLINLLSKKIKKICIQQIQLEEDTAKQIYQDNIIKLDFNRCGVGLLEIVTAPDFENAEEVLLFLERLQFLLRYYQISTANLHKGSMRCDVNISLGKKKRNDVSWAPRVEIKNLNSFQFIKNAIHFEINRQTLLLENSLSIESTPETRKYNEQLKSTEFMRVKNTDQEYCYLYEPNLRKFKLTKSFQELQLKGIPETPEEIQTSLIKVHDINDITLKKLINKPVLLLLLYRYCQQIDQWKNEFASFLINELSGAFKENQLETTDFNLLHQLSFIFNLTQKSITVNIPVSLWKKQLISLFIQKKDVNTLISEINLYFSIKIDWDSIIKQLELLIIDDHSIITNYVIMPNKIVNALIGKILQQINKPLDIKILREQIVLFLNSKSALSSS